MSQKKVIDSFSGDYRFLSNFWPSPLRYHGEWYPTVEHAFQARKTKNIDERRMIQSAASPALAKQLGRKVTLRANWDELKVDVMLALLRLKFKAPGLRQQLLATGNAELVEGNWWGDTTWGVCRGEGKNLLGKLLMQVRKEIQAGQGPHSS